VTRRNATETVALLAAPAVAFWLMHFTPMAQNAYVDPYVYTGYIHNFVDLFERYGVTYYGVRFGIIVPAQLTAALFGPIAGFFVLRYVLVLVAGIPFYLLVKQRHGLHPALATFFLCLTSPFLARTVLWDYPDASGVMFLLAAICLFSIEHERRRLLDVAAGICAGMALHSNVFAAAPLSIYFASYTMVWLWRGGTIAQIVRRLILIAASVAAVSALGAAYYWWRIGVADIFTITLKMALGLAGGGMDNWRTPGIAWMGTLWWALTPAVLVLFTTLMYLHRRGHFHETVVLICLIGTTAFYAVSQFFLHADFLELFYYFSYTLPIVFLSLASIVACLWRWSNDRMRGASAVLLLAAATGPWVLRSFDVPFAVPRTFTEHIIIVTIALACAATAFRLRRSAPSLVASVALGFMVYSSFATRGDYASMVNSRLRPNRAELDVYRVALQFIRSVPAIAEKAGAIRFWYHNRPPGSLQSIQSTYLWGYSKVQGGDADRGLPYLGMPEVTRILEPGVKWLGLLAEEESELPRARTALLEQGISGETVSHRVLTAGDYTVYLDLIEVARTSPLGVSYGIPIIVVTDHTPLQVNVYGTPKGQVTTNGNRVTFIPTDERDHVASPFAEISPLSGDSWARVVVDWPDKTVPSCQLIIQDEDFNPLDTLGCSSTTRYVKVPATTQKLRVNLTDPDRREFVLPRRIEVALAEQK
jgi:hypothetical protein